MTCDDGEIAFERAAHETYTTTSGKGSSNVHVHELKWSSLNKERFFFFGSTFFLSIRALVYPATLVKTRLQVAKREGAYVNLRSAFRDIVKHEGLRGFYKGFGVSIAGALPSQPLYAACFEVSREWLGKLLRGALNPACEANYGWKLSETMVDGVSNAFGGLCATLASQSIVVPADVISQLSMVNQTSRKGGYSIAATIVRSEGLPGLYRGFWASLMTYAPSSAVWWFTYGAVKRNILFAFEEKFGRLATNSEALAMQSFSGACAGFMSAVLLTPLDVIRTRSQVLDHRSTSGAHDSMFQVAKGLLEEDGIRGFGRGVTARVLNTVPVSALIILSYETAKKLSTM